MIINIIAAILATWMSACYAANSPWLGQPWGTWLATSSQAWMFPNPDDVRSNYSVTDRGWIANKCLATFGTATQMVKIRVWYLQTWTISQGGATVDDLSSFTPLLNLSYTSLFLSPNPWVPANNNVGPRVACGLNAVVATAGDQIILMVSDGALGLPSSTVVYSEVFLNFNSQSNYTVGMNSYPCTWYGCQLGWFNPPYTFTNVVLCTQCSSPWWGAATITGTDLLVEFSFQLVSVADATGVPEIMIPFLAAMNARVCTATNSYSACSANLLGPQKYIQITSLVVTAQPTLMGAVGSSMTTDSAMQYLSWTTLVGYTWGVCSAARASLFAPTPLVAACFGEPDSVAWGGYSVSFPQPSWACRDPAGYDSTNYMGPIIVQAGRRSMYYRRNTLLARDSASLLTNPTSWNQSVVTVLTYGQPRAVCDVWAPTQCNTEASTWYSMSHSLMMTGAVSADGTLFYAMDDVYAPPTIAVYDTRTLQRVVSQSIMPMGSWSTSGDLNQFDGLPIAFLTVDGTVLGTGTSPASSSSNPAIYADNPLGPGSARTVTIYEDAITCLPATIRNGEWLWRCLTLPQTCTGIMSQWFSNEGRYQCERQAMLYYSSTYHPLYYNIIDISAQWVQQKCSASYNQPFYHSWFMAHPTQQGVVYMLTPPRAVHPNNLYPNYIPSATQWTNVQTVQYFTIAFAGNTASPTTATPSFQPEPTPNPTVGPTFAPFAPVSRPTYAPFAAPSMYPTYLPSLAPTIQPTPVNYTAPPSPGPFNTAPVSCANLDVYGVATTFNTKQAVCPYSEPCQFNASYSCPPGLYNMQLGPNGRTCGGYLRYCTASEFQLYYGATIGVPQPSYCQYMCDVDDPTRCVAMFSVPANWNLPYTTSTVYAGIAGATTQLTFDNVRSDSFVVDQSGVYSDCWRGGGVRYVTGSDCVLNSCLLFNSGATPLDTVTSTTLVQCRRNDGLPRGNASFTVSLWFRYQNLTSPNSTMVQFTRHSRYSGPVTNSTAAPDYLVIRDLGGFYARYLADFTQPGTIVLVSNSTMNSTCNVSWGLVSNPAAVYPPPNCRNGAGVSVPCYINATIYASVANCASATGNPPFNITTNATFSVVTTTGVVSLGATVGGFNQEDVLGEWHHYVLVYDGQTNLTRRYLDGAPALVNFSNTQPQGPVPSFPNFGADVMLVLGNDGNGGGGFRGYIDEFVIFNHTLSAADVQTLYAWPSIAPKSASTLPVATRATHQGPVCSAACGNGVQSCTFVNRTNVTCVCAPTSIAINGVACQAQGAVYGQCSSTQMLQYCGVESAVACRTRTFWLSASAAAYVNAYIDTSVVNYASANTLAGAASAFVFSGGLIADVALGVQGTNAVVMPECLCTNSAGWRSMVAPNAVVSAAYSYGAYRARTWLCSVQDQVTAQLVSTLDDAPPVTAAGYCNGVGSLSRKFDLQIPHAQPSAYSQLYDYANTRNRMWDTWEEQQQQSTIGNMADLAFNISVGVLNPAFFYDSFVGVSAATGTVLALGATAAAALVAANGPSALILPTSPYYCEFYFLQVGHADASAAAV